MVGEVDNFIRKPCVAAKNTCGPIKLGNELSFLGARSGFTETVNSMEINHEKVNSVESDSKVAIRVSKRVRKGDKVYLLRY